MDARFKIIVRFMITPAIRKKMTLYYQQQPLYFPKLQTLITVDIQADHSDSKTVATDKHPSSLIKWENRKTKVYLIDANF